MMARPQITLTVSDERGRSERVAVESTRFTIGSSSDNDLALDDPTLSRRHALIESFDGLVQLSDCGSESGTFINGKPVKGGVILRDGDMVAIGSACHIRVSINDPRVESSIASNQTRTKQSAALSADSIGFIQRFSTPVIALISVGLILLVAVPFMVFLNKDSGNRTGRVSRSRERENENRQAPDPRRPEDEPAANANIDAPSKALTIEDIEKVAVQFMRRISSDDKPYVFPSYAVNALGDIKHRVEQYSQSPAIAGALNSMVTAAPTIAAAARREGIEPGLVISTALAEAEGARAANAPVETARRILPGLLSLRKTLGTESIDKSLILVAAFKMGGGTKKSHPLLRTMTRAVKNPLTDRNVWYLRGHESLDNEAYEFVVNFLALGIISENPRRFGIAAPPISY
jgi:hypothetical protein